MRTFTLYHINPNVKTLEEFCKTQGIHFDADNSQRADKYQLQNFFDDNKERILSQMTDKNKRDYIIEKNLQGDNGYKRVEDLSADDLVIDMTIPCPMKLVINNRLVSYTLSAKHNTFQEMTNDITAFEDEQIRGSILQDIINFKGARRKRPKCSVIGFFKSMYYSKKENSGVQNDMSDIYQMKSNFINISKFITSLTTNVSVQGGTFSFQLPHIPFYNKLDNSLMLSGGLHGNGSDNETGALAKYMDADAFSKDAYFLSGEESNYPVVKASIDTLDYWIWLISTNDLIFISFDEITDISDDNIACNNFDMIGLVESVSLSRDANGNTTVNVQGKDLMKLLSDDASLFFPCATVVDQGNFFDNTEGALNNTGDLGGVGTINGQSRDKVAGTDMLRMPSTSSIRLFRQECNGFSIDYIIKVVISALANIQICPSEIFGSWGDRVTTFAYLTPAEEADATNNNQQQQ